MSMVLILVLINSFLVAVLLITASLLAVSTSDGGLGWTSNNKSFISSFVVWILMSILWASIAIHRLVEFFITEAAILLERLIELLLRRGTRS
jgi:hypothetical protein